VTFDDGPVAEVRTEKEPPLLKDHRYALFTWTQRKRQAFAKSALMKACSSSSRMPRSNLCTRS
jgi:hypothetical protein